MDKTHAFSEKAIEALKDKLDLEAAETARAEGVPTFSLEGLAVELGLR